MHYVCVISSVHPQTTNGISIIPPSSSSFDTQAIDSTVPVRRSHPDQCPGSDSEPEHVPAPASDAASTLEIIAGRAAAGDTAAAGSEPAASADDAGTAAGHAAAFAAGLAEPVGSPAAEAVAEIAAAAAEPAVDVAARARDGVVEPERHVAGVVAASPGRIVASIAAVESVAEPAHADEGVGAGAERGG